MSLQFFSFLLGILLPYGIEQYAYSRSIPAENKNGAKPAKTVLQGYGWRLIWDTSYFVLFMNAGYRIIFTPVSFSTFELLGYFCFLFGVALRIWSLKEIGRFYDSGIVVKADHQLVRSGPYRILRHPLHIGTLAQIGGLASLAPIWLALPIVFVSLLVGLYINRTEDHAHSQLLGSSFETYYRQTWDLVDLIFWKKRLR